MRIGILCHCGVGGSARVAVELSGQLAQRGHDVHLFARSAPFGMAEPPPGVELHALSDGGAASPRLDADWSARDVEALTTLAAGVAREADLDLLHFHFAVPFAKVAAAVRARLGERAPAIVGTLHGTDVSVFGRRPAWRRVLAEQLAAADELTSVSHSHAALSVRLLGIGALPTVVPNFIDLDRWGPRERERSERPRVAHVSNLRPVKRPGAMARIFAGARQERDGELWLVGEGEGLPAVEATLRRAGVAGDVRRFGLRLDLEAILPHADVLLVTSRTESFCLAALEAASCGLPVVAPRVGGLPEVVRDGETGLLHERGDDADAVRALVLLLGDAELRERMGRAALARAASFAADTVVPRYERLYADVLDGRAGAREPAAASLQV